MADIQLERLAINSFMGIDKSRPVLLDLGKNAKKGKTVTTMSGDQQTGKSSTLMAIMYMLGAAFDFDVDNLINKTDGTINGEQEFTADGKRYRVKMTKSKFTLERDVDGEWFDVKEPKTTLQKIVGNLGVSPMHLKELDGDKQIIWFQKTFSADEKTIKKEEKLRASLKTIVASRRDANREYTRLKKALEINEMFQDAEENYKRFEKPVTMDTIEQNFTKVQEEYNKYTRAKDAMPGLKGQVAECDAEIEELKKKLAEKEAKRVELADRVAKNEAWLAENAIIEHDFKEAKEAYMKSSQEVTDYNNWQAVLKQKKEMDEYETMVQKFDGQKDEHLQELMELSKKYMPKIPGLKIHISNGMDDDAPEGIFYNKKTLAQLSESELWGLFFQIWEQKDVQFVFVENVTSLGTNAVEILNELAKKGIKIFATMMDRKKSVMKIEITDNIK